MKGELEKVVSQDLAPIRAVAPKARESRRLGTLDLPGH